MVLERLIGGGMANTFLKAQGYEIGASLFEEGKVVTARDLITKAHQRNVELLLPVDVVIADRFEAGANTKVVVSNQVEPGWRIMDIGPQTIAACRQALADAQTIIFNGPLGVAEWPVFAQGTNAMIKESSCTLLRVSSSRATVAQTPKEVIWTLNKARLYHYIPVVPAEQGNKVPLLLVFALMNKPYILDLRPRNSYIEYMVKQGYDVYLLDWGVPGPEDKDLKFDDYVLDYLTRAVRKLKAVSGSDELSMLGWCIGAILAPIYVALRPDDSLKNLILLTAPLDFSDKTAGGFVRWMNDQHFDPIRSSTPSVSYMVVRMEARKQHQKVAVVHGAWYKEKYVLREGEWGKHEKRIN